MANPIPTSRRRRASHRLPVPIFAAIMNLEDEVRRVATMNPQADTDEFIRATIHVGVLRDQLAALILEVSR